MRVAPPTVEALSAGATLGTANRRLARAIALAYERHQAGSGCAFGESADTLPWPAWLRRGWHDHVSAAGGDEPVLLSEAQEDLLWERIIEDSPESGGLAFLTLADIVLHLAPRRLC